MTGFAAPFAAVAPGAAAAPSGMFAGGVLDLVMGAVFLTVPVYLVLQVLAFVRVYRKRPRATLVPALLMAAVYVSVAVGVARGSNLAPIWIVLTSPAACLYVGLLLVLDWRPPPPRRR